MQPDRDALFSPARSSIVARVLPSLCLGPRENEDAVMASIDVKDAFLTVYQQTPAVVRCQMADGQSVDHQIGKGLPGQRDGSQLWHRAVTSLFKKELSMSEHTPYPCILKTPDNSCIALIHVDDILVVGRRSFVVNKLIKCLEKSYVISIPFLQRPGDELTFLKRTVTLQHDGRLTIQTHHKPVQRLYELWKTNPKLQSKKIPGHSDMDQMDESADLDPGDAAVFRTCVGVLLYLAADLPHCQHAVRHLATYSTRPSQKSLVVLKHLVGYLARHESVCVSLKWKGRAMGIYHKYELPPGEVVLEVFADSDRASDRTSRRSISRERRYNNASTRERRVLYGDRVTILHGLRGALASEHAGFRASALRSLGGMSDISDDEESSNFSSINAATTLAQASRAVHFIASLQSAGSSSTGFSTNVDMVAKALLRGIDRQADAANDDEDAGESDEGHVETMAEQRTRYLNSEQCPVSDPELWVLLHYGEEAESESDAS
eukprot:s3208_g6.t1